MSKSKTPTSPDEATTFDKRLASFNTTLPDKVTVGWDTCGKCELYYTKCTCSGGCRLPRHVISMRADAVRRLSQKGLSEAAESVDEPSETDPPVEDQQVSEDEPGATTDEADSDEYGAYVCPSCDGPINEDESPCRHCEAEIDWEEVDE